MIKGCLCGRHGASAQTLLQKSSRHKKKKHRKEKEKEERPRDKKKAKKKQVAPLENGAAAEEEEEPIPVSILDNLPTQGCHLGSVWRGPRGPCKLLCDLCLVRDP
jgi:hypothetical protein